MSALPQHSNLAPLPPGWQQRRGLSFHEAELLLDQLEAGGIRQRAISLEPDGVCVRWRDEWPRLLAE